MGDGNSLINLGGVSKIGELLIEKISEGIGGLARPWQIKRIAKAEAKAAKIHALAEIERDELKRRALTRFVAEEMNKQSNMESITSKAVGGLSEDARPQDMENDWIANFFDRCKLISDEQMQSLWARVLAGEANNPGRYSKRTVNLLSSLDKSDAELFTKLCGFAWEIGTPAPLVFDHNHQMYKRNEITFEALCHLESIGLITFNYITSYIRTGLPKNAPVHYFGQSLLIQFNADADNSLDIGQVLLTQQGRELTSVSGSVPVEGFLEFVVTHWVSRGLVVYSEWPNPNGKATN